MPKMKAWRRFAYPPQGGFSDGIGANIHSSRHKIRLPKLRGIAS